MLHTIEWCPQCLVETLVEKVLSSLSPLVVCRWSVGGVVHIEPTGSVWSVGGVVHIEPTGSVCSVGGVVHIEPTGSVCSVRGVVHIEPTGSVCMVSRRCCPH